MAWTAQPLGDIMRTSRVGVVDRCRAAVCMWTVICLTDSRGMPCLPLQKLKIQMQGGSLASAAAIGAVLQRRYGMKKVSQGEGWWLGAAGSVMVRRPCVSLAFVLCSALTCGGHSPSVLQLRVSSPYKLPKAVRHP